MSFGRELSDRFQKFTGGYFESELVLFTKLQDAFIELQQFSKYHGAIDIIHGSKSYVEFEHNATYVSNPSSGGKVKKELSDLLFVVFSTKNGLKIRIMYMQNKKGESDCKFTADLLQLHLLRERKKIISKPLPDCVFGNSKILSDAILPSVGSYGVFYQCPNNAISVDMAYYPAERIDLFKTTGNLQRKVKYSSNNYGIIDNSKGYPESQGERNLESFGESLVAMHIGTPILSSDSAYGEVVDFLYRCSPVFRQAYPLENMNLDNKEISIGSLPNTYIINADMILKLNES